MFDVSIVETDLWQTCKLLAMGDFFKTHFPDYSTFVWKYRKIQISNCSQMFHFFCRKFLHIVFLFRVIFLLFCYCYVLIVVVLLYSFLFVCLVMEINKLELKWKLYLKNMVCSIRVSRGSRSKCFSFFVFFLVVIFSTNLEYWSNLIAIGVFLVSFLKKMYTFMALSSVLYEIW